MLPALISIEALTVILVDSNVLIDVIEDDKRWADWSQQRLDQWAGRGLLLINPVVYAEISVSFASIEALERTISTIGLEWSELPKPGLFLAAQAHHSYRRRGGAKHNVLADFFIGAHAAVLNVPLLTRDPQRFQSYFPKLVLVHP